MGSYVTARPTKYCHACGTVIDAMAAVCPGCGVPQSMPMGLSLSEKRVLPAFLLALFLGVFGVHRFYAGRWASGVLQLVTFGGFGIWALIDVIMIACGGFKDAEGNKIVEWT